MTTPTNFKFCDPVNYPGSKVDFDDVFVQKCSFIDRSPWIWGAAGAGQLGNNSTINQYSPVQTVASGIRWSTISAGGTAAAAAAIKTDGTLWLWGCNVSGSLGNNSTINQSSPVQTVSSENNWKSVSASSGSGPSTASIAAIKTDGTLWLWGSGSNGNLGNSDTIAQSLPVQTISQGTNWCQVSVSPSNSAAVKTDGTLWLWGSNGSGRLGNNSGVSTSSPVQTACLGTNWCQVSVGPYHSAAVKTDGTLWLWGGNITRQLGTVSTANRSIPVQTLTQGTNWKQVSVGSTGGNMGFSAAVKTDGTLWLWGSGNSGVFGNNSTLDSSSPVQTVSSGINWKTVSVSAGNSAAIKTDGTLWLWGCGTSGQLGNNAATNRSSPVQTVTTSTDWIQVSAGSGITIGLREENYW